MGVDIKYPQVCHIYVMVEHLSGVMWFHAWNGNQHPCTANLNKQWNGISDLNFADINGVWKLKVQETNGQSTGFIDYWFIRLYYQDDSTPTPTPTLQLRNIYLPLILSAW